MTTTQDMAGEPLAVVGAPVTHEHGWWVESRHATSRGCVLYVRCAVCGARRVDLVAAGEAIPEPMSVVISNRSGV